MNKNRTKKPIKLESQPQITDEKLYPYLDSQAPQEKQEESYAIKFDDPQSSKEKEITLNEPVIDTIKRDLGMIVVKLKYAMIPSLRGSQKAKKELMHWDLWGPFILTLLLATTLSLRTEQSSSTIITSIFFIMWVGAVVVYLNASFLGSHMSIFQSICLLGYCVFPINIVSMLTYLLSGFLAPSLKLALVALSFVWATMCSISFVGELIPARKRKLALYPIFLFYLFLSWFVLIV